MCAMQCMILASSYSARLSKHLLDSRPDVGASWRCSCHDQPCTGSLCAPHRATSCCCLCGCQHTAQRADFQLAVLPALIFCHMCILTWPGHHTIAQLLLPAVPARACCALHHLMACTHAGSYAMPCHAMPSAATAAMPSADPHAIYRALRWLQAKRVTMSEPAMPQTYATCNSCCTGSQLCTCVRRSHEALVCPGYRLVRCTKLGQKAASCTDGNWLAG